MVKHEVGDERGSVRLRDRVERAVDAAGNGYLAVSGELLVAGEAASEVADALEDLGGIRARRRRAGAVRRPDVVATDDRVVRLSFATAADLRARAAAPLAEVLAGVRALLADRRSATPPRAVGPNHVFVGEGLYSGGPADVATPTATLGMPDGPAGERVRVEVLDTGLFLDHRWWAPSGSVSAQSIEQVTEPTDVDGGGALDDQAGHGTFVAGIVAQEAPGAKICTRAVLDSYGQGDEASIAQAIRDAAAAFRADSTVRWLVLNLSLGGYTDGDAAPLDILDALDALPPEVVVVAAAGNDHPNGGRPFFPAALKRVLAVAALDAAGAPAGFSNRGHWVDACTLGVGVGSSFFDGFQGPLSGSPDPDDFAGFAVWSGTSFAAPRVAGKIAAVLSGQIGATDEPQVRHLLRRRGHPMAADFAPGSAQDLADLGLVIP